MQQRDKLFINGRWVAPQGKGVTEMVHSATEAVMGTIPEGDAADAGTAVAAVRAALDDWAATPVVKRAEHIQRITDGLHARSEGPAQLITGKVGMPIKLARAIQVGGPTHNWSNFAKPLSMFELEEHVDNSSVAREPMGVVGVTTPRNYPLNQITLKVAPALAAGRMVMLKPSKAAPLGAFVLAEITEEAGLLPGVLNLVTGYGPVVDEVLADDPEVDMVSFTGSARTGKRMAELTSQSVKRVTLELGGKSVSVTLDDADLASAAKDTLSVCFLNSGQTYSVHARILVPRAKYEKVKALAAQLAAAYVPGDPAQESTRLGPLISAVQCDRALDYTYKGLEEGAELITGGADTSEGLTTGYFVKLTVLGNIKTTDTVAHEEIFGPVLIVICYNDEEEAVRIVSDSIYGLGGDAWLGDEIRMIRVVRRIRTGQVSIDGGPFNMQAPFSGYKQSGNGRESGKYGLEEFLEYKALQLNPAKTV